MTRFDVSWSLGLAGAVALVLAGGCASQGTVDELRSANRALHQRNTELEHEATDATNRSQSYEERLAAAEQGWAEADQRAMAEAQASQNYQTEASNRIDRLVEQLDSIELTALPVNLDQALRDLADRSPDLTYDPDRGMVRLASDLTFELGSDQVRPEAIPSVQRLAEILNEGSYQTDLAVRVEGHTDNVPISRPATRAKHPTNMHLSVHRAISVRNILVDAGMSEDRITVLGHGSERPIVPNPPGGARENRRVEIFVVAYTGPAVAAAPTEMAAPNEVMTAVPAPIDEPMK